MWRSTNVIVIIVVITVTSYFIDTISVNNITNFCGQ